MIQEVRSQYRDVGTYVWCKWFVAMVPHPGLGSTYLRIVARLEQFALACGSGPETSNLGDRVQLSAGVLGDQYIAEASAFSGTRENGVSVAGVA